MDLSFAEYILIIKIYQDRLVKINYYLSHSNFETQNIFSKFRICYHKFQIEAGPYRKIPREG